VTSHQGLPATEGVCKRIGGPQATENVRGKLSLVLDVGLELARWIAQI
jgi:hypothetical protein